MRTLADVARDGLRRRTGLEPTDEEVAAAVARREAVNRRYADTAGSGEPPTVPSGPGVNTTQPVGNPQRGTPGVPGAGITDPRATDTRNSTGVPNTSTPTTTSSKYGTTPYTDRGSSTVDAGNRGNFTGFDFDQDPNNRLLGKSAKYTTAHALNEMLNAGHKDIWKTKAGAQHMAEQWLKPRLEAQGFEVLEIIGDKMFVRDYADRAAGRPGSWIDWVVNADGDNPLLGWQVEQERTGFGALEDRYAPVTGAPEIPGYADPYGPPPGGDPGDDQEDLTPDERAYRLLAIREQRENTLGQLGRRNL